MESTELPLAEGGVVEVLRVGAGGWWFARDASTQAQGWVPSTYLQPLAPRGRDAAPTHASTHASTHSLYSSAGTRWRGPETHGGKGGRLPINLIF